MKIGLLMYANDMFFRGGIWRYSYNLARSLVKLDKQNDYTFVHGRKIPENFRNLDDKEQIWPLGRIGKIWKLPELLREEQFDVVHETANFAPIFRQVNYKKIMTLHDLIPIKFPGTIDIKSLMYYKFYLPITLRQFDYIITPSNNSKEDINELYKIPASKIKVIYHGIEEKFFEEVSEERLNNFKKKYKLNFPFILLVRGIDYRKNPITIFRAFAAMPREFQKSFKIVVLGGVHPSEKEGDIIREMRRLKIEDKVIIFDIIKSDSDYKLFYIIHL